MFCKTLVVTSMEYVFSKHQDLDNVHRTDTHVPRSIFETYKQGMYVLLKVLANSFLERPQISFN